MLQSGSDYHPHVQSLDSSLNTGQFSRFSFWTNAPKSQEKEGVFIEISPANFGLQIACFSAYEPVVITLVPTEGSFLGGSWSDCAHVA
jgi:hypothetical protein